MWHRLIMFVAYIACLYGCLQLGRHIGLYAYTTPASNLPHEICRSPNIDFITKNQVTLLDHTPPPPDNPIVFLPGNIETVKKQTYTKDDIGSPDLDGSFRILIIPIGYDNTDIDAHFGPIVAQAETVWDKLGLKVRYAYLRRSLPIPIYQYESMLSANDPSTQYALTNAVWNQLSENNIYTFHVMSLYVNSDVRLSSSTNGEGGGYQTVVGENNWNLYALIHETAHNLILSDGYEKLYSHKSIADGTNTELFLDVNKLPVTRQQLLKATKTEVIKREFVCNSQKVLSPSGAAESMMDTFYNNDDVIQGDQVNPKTFTPYQTSLMKAFIEAKLAQTP